MKNSRKSEVLSCPESLCRFLAEQGLIEESRSLDILKSWGNQRKKLLKIRDLQSIQLMGNTQEEISPVDVLVSMRISISGRPNEYLTEEHIMRSVADSLGLMFQRIDPLELDLEVVTRTIAKPFAMKHLVIPLTLRDRCLTVAMANPFQWDVLDDIRRVTGLKVTPVVSTKSDVIKIIKEFYGFKASIVLAEKELASSAVDLGNLEQYVKLKSLQEISSTDRHIKNAVDYLFHYALDQRSSDIHIEPKRDSSLIRLRIDGILHTIYTMPKGIHPSVISRIKTLARMDIAEKRRPQDGRIKISHNEKSVELRVSTIPVAFGEKIVIRLLDPTVLFQELGELGFAPGDLIQYNSIIQRPHGIVLVTGPTGSGKTTTLYSTMKYLSGPENNITTVEDPIEMICEEFNQIAVQPAVGITFASILRHVLRQDPDIIMIGEIRDYETAENAAQAALTGHLVLSTLHTNDAPGSVIRLMDLGIEPFLINSTLNGVLAQRLLRKICPHCAETFSLEKEEAELLKLPLMGQKRLKLSRGKGCSQCRMTGYLGRTGIFEVFKIDDKVRSWIRRNATSETIRKAAVESKMTFLRDNALRKMMRGTTTYQEILRVAGMG